jgi:hypothetical protein
MISSESLKYIRLLLVNNKHMIYEMSLKFKRTEIDGLYIIENFLSSKECEEYIKRADEKGWEFIDRGIADYDRAIIINEYWASELFSRFREYIPTRINDYIIVGLNDHFRFSKYHKGGRFEKHIDGVNINKNGNRSYMTLNIFLNDIEEGGGGTIFYSNDTTIHVAAKKGRAALFSNGILHEGEKVEENYKYLMRTDIMVYDLHTKIR